MKAVSIRPDYGRATHYGQYWSKELFNKVIKEVERYTLIDLFKNGAVREKLPKDATHAIISGVCHGNKEVIVGQHDTVLFTMDDFTKDYCKDKHFWTLSCLAGSRLLPWMVKQGARSAMGYKKTFKFWISRSGYPNSKAKPFFDSHFTGVQSLVKGKDPHEAYKDTIDRFNHWIKNTDEDKIKSALKHDRDCSDVWSSEPGRPTAKITVPLKPKPKERKGNIEFTVTDSETGEPIKGAEVHVDSHDAITDENGKVRFTGVPIERYEYTVNHEGYNDESGVIKKDDFD